MVARLVYRTTCVDANCSVAAPNHICRDGGSDQDATDVSIAAADEALWVGASPDRNVSVEAAHGLEDAAKILRGAHGAARVG